LSSAATAFTADAPRAFSPSKPIARTLTAGDRSAVIRPSIVAASNAGDLRHETLRSDPVDRARQRVVEILVAADARVDPVADIQRAVRTDGDVRRPEERRDRALTPVVAADEVRPGILLLHVRGQEDLAIEIAKPAPLRAG
jgi:hypothetical protein